MDEIFSEEFLNCYESGSANISASAAEQERSSARIHTSGADEWESNSSDDDLYFGDDEKIKCPKRMKGGRHFDEDFFHSSNK